MAAAARAASTPAGQQAEPRVDMIGRQQIGGCVGADPEEGHLAEREHPRVTADDVPGHAHHAEQEHHDHDVHGKRAPDDQRIHNEEEQNNSRASQPCLDVKVRMPHHPNRPCGRIQTVIR